jgi:hypothetical protein
MIARQRGRGWTIDEFAYIPDIPGWVERVRQIDTPLLLGDWYVYRAMGQDMTGETWFAR